MVMRSVHEYKTRIMQISLYGVILEDKIPSLDVCYMTHFFTIEQLKYILFMLLYDSIQI